MTSLKTAHAAFCRLIENFEAHEYVYLGPDYQEAEARKDFIDPLLMALGWDVDHQIQKNPFEQEVKVEKDVVVGRGQKRADYAFFLAPNFRDVRFFVEAKKPSWNLKKDADAFFQTIRYGWSAGTPLAVLTDFAQLLVLDCRSRPDIETVLTRLHRSYAFRDLRDLAKFAEVYWLFSREALGTGAHDRYVSNLPKPRGAARQLRLFKGSYRPVDETFLDELEQYRSTLARSFKQTNPTLDGHELTEVTQRVLEADPKFASIPTI